ncbi:MAG: glutamine-hydrolyzing carbamoyl-phosphate synthase small subunit [Geminicoccaceae bacterium]|nr:glutamine-hydrolyzing carbamoyl-phosphate synthase small subunit [Geminicoccaceae bacterium]
MQAARPTAWPAKGPTAWLVLADGTAFAGRGFGAAGERAGELVFNTAMTGYQEILTDPSYAGQIVTFTFPHIGNVGANELDIESSTPFVRGLVTRAAVTAPSSWRRTRPLLDWLEDHGIVGIGGVDTRALTARLRDEGAQNAVLLHDPEGAVDVEALRAKAAALPPMEGTDLVPEVTCAQRYTWDEGGWDGHVSYARRDGDGPHVVVLDYGVKRNILRSLADLGCRVTVLPATASAQEVLALDPDGVVLANGPGDPAATGRYAVTEIESLLASGKPLFGICLGHQMLALALGAPTRKMPFGHHGANHPVQDLATGRVEITSQNHGFAIADADLPQGVAVTHRSLFDGTIQGIRLEGKPVFSVQYHPEASPGPDDGRHLFERFLRSMEAR